VDNRGVAPVYIPCAVAIALVDDAGTRASVAWPEAFRPSTWMPARETAEKARVAFAGAAPGTYRLALALTRARDDATPYVRLGTDLPAHDGWYDLGPVDLAGGK
jgi:hypothetical protein